MNSRKRLLALGGCVLLGLASLAPAQTVPSETQELRAQITAMQTRIAQLESQQQQSQDNWLNARRAEEIKALVTDVLKDADTRASLLEDGMAAGHNGKHFFVGSESGDFLLELSGQFDMRAIWNYENKRADKDDFGFQMRRTKLTFAGHVANPNIKYEVKLAIERTDGNVYAEDAWVSYDGFMDGLTIKAGKYKLPFLREELTSSSKQLAVERSSANEYFTLNRAEQVEAIYTQDMWKAAVSFNDGSNSEYSDFGADTTEIALTARLDVKLMGAWSQMSDYSAWSGEENAAFVGAAVHWELGDAQNGGLADYVAYTVDGSFEMAGANISAAFIGASLNPDTGTTVTAYGAVVQGGYMVIPDKLEPFLRWEWIDDGVAGTDALNALTFGANYYLNKHNAKFTCDLVWIVDGDVPTANPYGASALSSGLGLDSTAANDQIAFRAQFQLLF